MSLRSLMFTGRQFALTLMPDEGAITRGGDGGSFDPTTGVFTPDPAATVYRGRCRVRKPTQVEQQTVFGDLAVTVSRYLVNLPHDAPLVEIGDVFVLTETEDGELAGVPMRVTAVIAKTVLVYRQLGVEIIE